LTLTNNIQAMKEAMKEADLILCRDGNRVIKNREGSINLYSPAKGEEATRVMARPATESDIYDALEGIGVNPDRCPGTVLGCIKPKLPYIPSTGLARGGCPVDGKYPDYYHYEPIGEEPPVPGGSLGEAMGLLGEAMGLLKHVRGTVYSHMCAGDRTVPPHIISELCDMMGTFMIGCLGHFPGLLGGGDE
jgi:hypothetical protein